MASAFLLFCDFNYNIIMYIIFLKERMKNMQNNNLNYANQQNVGTIISQFLNRKENLLEIKRKQLEAKPVKTPLNKEFLESKLEENGAITSEKGYLDVMIGGINEEGNEHLCLPFGMATEEEKLDRNNMFKREKIEIFLRNIKRDFNKPEFSFILNKPFKLKINSMNLEFNNLFELLSYIENLRKISLSKYHTFIKKINENIDEKIKTDVKLKNEEEKAEMKRKLFEEYNFKNIRIYGIRFKRGVNEVLEKEIKFLRNLYKTIRIAKYLKEEKVSENEYQNIIEKDLINVVGFYGKNTISSYEHLLYATPLDEEKEIELELGLKNFYKIKTGNEILFMGDPIDL